MNAANLKIASKASLKIASKASLMLLLLFFTHAGA